MNNQLPKKTGMAKFLQGFGFALQGLSYAFRTQCNIRVHVVIAALALIIALILSIPALELAVIILTITLVLSAELFNTAMETVVDLVAPEYHQLAKIAKDVSAAAVLVCAVGAVIIGMLLYGNAVLALLKQ